jgi:hypothetical protein
MTHIDPNFQRNAWHTHYVQEYAGQTATWRQYVSASAGNAMAGYGSVSYYREQTITAVFGGGGVGGGVTNANLEQTRAAGMIAEGNIRISTSFPLSNRDEVIWQGVRYRVDTNSQLSRMNQHYMSILVRGDS